MRDLSEIISAGIGADFGGMLGIGIYIHQDSNGREGGGRDGGGDAIFSTRISAN